VKTLSYPRDEPLGTTVTFAAPPLASPDGCICLVPPGVAKDAVVQLARKWNVRRPSGWAPQAWEDRVAGRIAVSAAYLAHASCSGIHHVATKAMRHFASLYACVTDTSHISIAHSNGWGAGACARSAVGLDIEIVRALSREVIDRVAEAEELDEIRCWRANPFDQAFWLLWTLKEAGAKVGGRLVPPQQVRTIGTFRHGVKLARPDGLQLHGRCYGDGNAVLAVAWPSAAGSQMRFEWCLVEKWTGLKFHLVSLPTTEREAEASQSSARGIWEATGKICHAPTKRA